MFLFSLHYHCWVDSCDTLTPTFLDCIDIDFKCHTGPATKEQYLVKCHLSVWFKILTKIRWPLDQYVIVVFDIDRTPRHSEDRHDDVMTWNRFPHYWPFATTRASYTKFYASFDFDLKKLFNKQSICWSFDSAKRLYYVIVNLVSWWVLQSKFPRSRHFATSPTHHNICDRSNIPSYSV